MIYNSILSVLQATLAGVRVKDLDSKRLIPLSKIDAAVAKGDIFTELPIYICPCNIIIVHFLDFLLLILFISFLSWY